MEKENMAAEKPKAKRLPLKGETEEDRQDAMIIYTTLDNIRVRFGQQMIPIELAILDIVMGERLKIVAEDDEPPE
jgi:hypothetical protein